MNTTLRRVVEVDGDLANGTQHPRQDEEKEHPVQHQHRRSNAADTRQGANDYEYLILDGFGRPRYRAATLAEAHASVAKEQSGPGWKPKRTILRRLKAGPWEPV